MNFFSTVHVRCSMVFNRKVGPMPKQMWIGPVRFVTDKIEVQIYSEPCDICHVKKWRFLAENMLELKKAAPLYLWEYTLIDCNQ